MKETKKRERRYPSDLSDTQWEEIAPLYSGLREYTWPNRGPSLVDGQLEYTFRGAHYTQTLGIRRAIVVYFDIKNSGGTDAAPSLHDLRFFHNDGRERLVPTKMTPKEMDSGVVNASKAGAIEQTGAGQTGRYCAVFNAGGEADRNGALWLVRYSDDYERTDAIAIPVSKDFETWRAE